MNRLDEEGKVLSQPALWLRDWIPTSHNQRLRGWIAVFLEENIEEKEVDAKIVYEVGSV